MDKGSWTFTQDQLRKLAGERSFERAFGYLGAVDDLDIGDGWVAATVHGTEAYAVELAEGPSGGIAGECDCPYGQDGNFCKHCVALGLTVLGQGADVAGRLTEAKARSARLDTWLASLSQADLLSLVREQLAADRGFRRRLELRSAAAGADPEVIRRQVTAMLDPAPFSRYGYIEYSDVHAYADQVSEAVAVLRGLVADGRAADAVAPARECLRRLDEVYEQADDSSGALGEAASDFAEVHLQACLSARPDPAQTAEWLVGYLLGEYASEAVDVHDYRDVLGTSGMAALRELAEEARSRNPRGWAEKALVESLLQAQGDVDGLVAVHAADLAPTGYTHLLIAGELTAAGRDSEALEWAERGLRHATAASHTDQRLVDWVCERYAAQGRTTAAVEVRRAHLETEPSLPTYQALRDAAQDHGSWDDERPAALARLRSLEQRGGKHTGVYLAPVLVDALIDDGAADEAWQAAREVGANDRQWLRLADLATLTHPADALAVYLRLIEPYKKMTGDRAYRDVARLLTKARDCHERLGTTDEFISYIRDLRADQKRKRNLMTILDQHKL